MQTRLSRLSGRLSASGGGALMTSRRYCDGFLRRRRRCCRRGLVTLAIESSCDDTAVAVLSHTADDGTRLLFNERIVSDNRAFKGVHPVATVRGHHASLGPLVQRALRAAAAAAADLDDDNQKQNQVQKQKPAAAALVPDFVSVTRGPGIMANLGVGLNLAKGLALAWDVALVGVHHMQAHALTPRLVHGPAACPFPFLTLLVSGGHTLLVHSRDVCDHRVVASTADIAVGNLLDQTARVVLPADVLAASPDVMYARALEQFAFPDETGAAATSSSFSSSAVSEEEEKSSSAAAAAAAAAAAGSEAYSSFFRPALSRADEMRPCPTGYAWTVDLPFRNSRRLAYSFSNIYTRVHQIADAHPHMDEPQRRALARHTMRAAFQHLCSRLLIALDDDPSLLPSSAAGAPSPTLVVAGGVACNKFLMHVLRASLDARGHRGVRILVPPAELCTDNAAMIAWAGMEMYRQGWSSDLSIRPVRKWPLEADGKDGILAVDGWVKSRRYSPS